MPEQPIIAFATAAEFRRWLARHHSDHPGIWLKIAKKASGVPSVTYAEALDEALCFGWIDGQKKAFDETAFLQKFTQRTKRSVWSKVNVGHVARLEKEGRMTPAGLAAVAAAKADGRWEAAYHSFSSAEMPEDFSPRWSESPTQSNSSRRSTKPNGIAFFSASAPPGNPRRGASGSRSLWRC